MKRCFRCGVEKPLDEFYKHPNMKDGRLGKCKTCTRRDASRHRAENIERVRAYDRQRANDPKRMALRARVAREWRQRHTGRSNAHTIAQRRHPDSPLECSRCGDDRRRIERHHPDYDEPDKIEWLCKPCHCKADKERRAREQLID